MRALALLATLAALAALATPAALAAPSSGAPWTAGTGTIDGNFIDGTTGGTPIAGQTVMLLVHAADGDHRLSTAVTDAQGLFHFGGLATDPADIYVVTAQYQGATYSTDPVALYGNPQMRLSLLAYEATSSDARIGIARVTILLHQPDVPHGTIGVAELATVVNGDQRTYVGTPGPADGKPMNLLRFALPAGATDLSVQDGFANGQILQVDRGFATTAPVVPGQTQFAFSYAYPYGSTRALFTYSALYPTAQVVVLAPPSLNVTAPALSALGTIPGGAGTSAVRAWESKPLLPGASVSLAMTQLPPPGEQSDLNPTLLDLLAALLALLAFGLVGYYLARKTRPELHPAPAGGSTTIASHADAEVASPDALLRALADLDRDRNAGRLDEAPYRVQRDALKAALKFHMRDSARAAGAGETR